MSTFSNLLNANKVLLLGLLAAVGTVVQQFVQSGPINYAVMGWTVVVAAIAFLANNLHGQVATILSSLLPTVDVIYESTKNNASISWGHMALLAGVAIVGAITGPAKAVATKASIIILLVMIGFTAQSQSIFKPLSKPKSANPYGRALTVQSNGDSIYTGIRLTGLQLLYGITDGYTASNVIATTGAGFDHATFKQSTQRWYTDYSIGLLVGANGHVAPNNLQTVGCAGAYIALFNKNVIISVIYDFVRPSGVNTNLVGAVGGNAALVPTN